MELFSGFTRRDGDADGRRAAADERGGRAVVEPHTAPGVVEARSGVLRVGERGGRARGEVPLLLAAHFAALVERVLHEPQGFFT